MSRGLIADAGRCQGCLACMTFCSMAKEGAVSLSLARIQVQLDPFGGHTRVAVCRQCKKAPCAAACPSGAIVLSLDGSYWAVDYEACTGCQVCVAACPFDAMLYDAEASRAIKCDSCGGSPICVDMCPTGALQWDGEEARG